MQITIRITYQLPSEAETEAGENVDEVFTYNITETAMSISTYKKYKDLAFKASWLSHSPSLVPEQHLVQYNTTITY